MPETEYSKVKCNLVYDNQIQKQQSPRDKTQSKTIRSHKKIKIKNSKVEHGTIYTQWTDYSREEKSKTKKRTQQKSDLQSKTTKG